MQLLELHEDILGLVSTRLPIRSLIDLTRVCSQLHSAIVPRFANIVYVIAQQQSLDDLLSRAKLKRTMFNSEEISSMATDTEKRVLSLSQVDRVLFIVTVNVDRKYSVHFFTTPEYGSECEYECDCDGTCVQPEFVFSYSHPFDNLGELNKYIHYEVVDEDEYCLTVSPDEIISSILGQ